MRTSELARSRHSGRGDHNNRGEARSRCVFICLRGALVLECLRYVPLVSPVVRKSVRSIQATPALDTLGYTDYTLPSVLAMYQTGFSKEINRLVEHSLFLYVFNHLTDRRNRQSQWRAVRQSVSESVSCCFRGDSIDEKASSKVLGKRLI